MKSVNKCIKTKHSFEKMVDNHSPNQKGKENTVIKSVGNYSHDFDTKCGGNMESQDSLSLEIVADSKKDHEENSDILNSVNIDDRKLLYDCVNGDLDKYKYCISLESENLPTVWVGIRSICQPIKHYICMKNEDGSLSTIFLNQLMKN